MDNELRRWMRLVETDESMIRLMSNPAFQKWFGDSRVVDAKGQPLQVYHGTFGSMSDDEDDDTADHLGIKKFNDQNHQGYWFSDRAEYADNFTFGGQGEIYPVYLSVQNPLEVELDDIEEPSEELLIRAQNSGYDGLYHRGSGENSGQWMVFTPNQIKSIWNRGTFDPHSDHISESLVDPEKLKAAEYQQQGVDTILQSTFHDDDLDAVDDDPLPKGLRQQPIVLDSPGFRRWFGDSQVVANGKPLVVYHGTQKDFTAFDPDKTGSSTDHGWFGKGIYLTPNPEVAANYAQRNGQGGHVMPLYVRAEQPFITDHDTMSPADVAAIQADGYDAIFRKVYFSDKIPEEIVVFDPAQIKSAIGNKGTFDPVSSNISEVSEFSRWVRLVEAERMEAKLSEAVVISERNLLVLSDPNKQQVAAMAKKASEGLRALIDDGVLYVWDAYYANHDEIARKIGIGDEISLHLWTAYVELDGAIFDNEHDEEKLDQIIETVKTNRALIRLYGSQFNIKVELDGHEVWR
jgi:hypothetical protein